MFAKLGANKAFNAVWSTIGKGFNQMGRGVSAARKGWGGLAPLEKGMAGAVAATGGLAAVGAVTAFQRDTTPRGWQRDSQGNYQSRPTGWR